MLGTYIPTHMTLDQAKSDGVQGGEGLRGQDSEVSAFCSRGDDRLRDSLGDDVGAQRQIRTLRGFGRVGTRSRSVLIDGD
jgi:hypothetical protein